MAAAVWSGAVAGRWWGPVWLGVIGLAGASAFGVGFRRPMVALVVTLALTGWWSGHSSGLREKSILDFETPSGPVDLDVRLIDDPRPGQHGWWVLAVADPPEAGRPASTPMLVAFQERPPGQAGETLRVVGQMGGRSGRARGDPYAGVLRAQVARLVEVPQAPWWAGGNRVRARALERLHGRGVERALLAGFLVGDTTGVPDADMEAMRRTGLTHLVAVSGSNVSLFLMLTLVAAGPLASGPRRRAVLGLAALVVLVVATRWEASVVRASVMAALVLAGRLGGWALDPATALAVTVTGVVAIFGELATDVGFVMSVLATLGVLVGANLLHPLLPRSLATALGATAGAQIAVAPVLLAVFGSVPLMAPVTNLIAVPVVAASTAVGAVGVALGVELLIAAASVGAGIVLAVAQMGAAWPQLGWFGVGLVMAALTAGSIRRWRPVVAVVAATTIAGMLVAGPSELPLPGIVVFDVGQGDAILVVAGDGRRLLVDGGPDPAVLERKLSHYGVTSLDLVVLTHVHADHATGLAAVLGRRPVGEIWLPSEPHSTPTSKRIEDLVEELGIPTAEAPVGRSFQVGDLTVEVLGPIRRYASANDQSVVLRIGTSTGRRLLLTGDIETYAQADLAGVEAEILKVPHQGGATSDLEWLATVGAELAVVSVGPNDFGHPSPEVLTALENTGSEVLRTDRDGDVVIPLGDGPR